MKTQTKNTLAVAIATLGMVGTSGAATFLSLANDGNAQNADSSFRTIDTNANGLGTDFRNGGIFAGHFNNTVNLNSTLSFELTGITDPADITNVTFSATQGIFGDPVNGSSPVNVELSVVRVSSGAISATSDDIQTSDHHSPVALVLSSNFDSDIETGTVSLDATGQGLLTTFLQDNYEEGQFLFLGLRQTGPAVGSGSGDGGFSYTDVVLEVTTVPEPSSAALLGLGGLALIMRRRK